MGINNLFDAEHAAANAAVQEALHAHVLLTKDVDYVALVFPGGSGAQYSRYDGEYQDLPSSEGGDPSHVSPAADISTAATSINELVVAALACADVLGPVPAPEAVWPSLTIETSFRIWG